MTISPHNEPEPGLIDDMFPVAEYQAAMRHRKQFLPWHRPRKQFVRYCQWLYQIEKLVQEVELESKTLRYLGLPGTDLLDIRYFLRTLCEDNQLELLFLGFNTAARGSEQTDLNISIDEVSKMPRIDTRSIMIPDDFCMLADERSVAWSHAKQRGPFDGINLDLCDGFANHPPGSLENTHYNAVAKLMALQSGKTQPWLLFLTTRTGRQDINQDTLERFIQKYRDNLSECAPFQARSEEIFGIANDSDLDEALRTPDGYLSVFLVAFCKWMIVRGLGQQPPFKVSVTSTLGYRISPEAEHNDLISIALRFEPTFLTAPDPMGIARDEASGPNECELAAATVRRVNNRKCVDTILREDSEVMENMVVATAELLELDRYDIGQLD